MAYISERPHWQNFAQDSWLYDWSTYDSPRSQSHFLSSPSPDSLPDSDDHSRRPSTPLSVKEEPDDSAPGCFIMELSAPQPPLAPPTEVPLRATQASSDMRRMMTVFRLNPFAMHSSGGTRGTIPVQYETAHPLDSEPITFEFQLDIEPGILDPEGPYTDDVGLTNAGLRSFSPEFELHDDLDTPKWPTYRVVEPASPSQDLSSWGLAYSETSDDRFSSISYHHQPSSRRPPRLHSSTSVSYLQKAATAGDSDYLNSSSSGVHYHTSSSHHQHHSISPQPEPQYPTWAPSTVPSSLRGGVPGYHSSATVSRSSGTSYNDSTLSARRWSLPDTHMPQPVPAFLTV